MKRGDAYTWFSIGTMFVLVGLGVAMFFTAPPPKAHADHYEDRSGRSATIVLLGAVWIGSQRIAASIAAPFTVDDQ